MQMIFSENTQLGEVRERRIEYQVSMQTKAHYDGGLKVLVVDMAVTLNHPDLRVDPQFLLGVSGDNRVLETHAYSALAIRRTISLADNLARRVREAIEKRNQSEPATEAQNREVQRGIERTVREATPGLEVQTT